MSRFIEQMESRSLFSATVGTLIADGKVLGSADVAARKQYLAGKIAIISDQKALSAAARHTGAGNAALIKSLESDEVAGLKSVQADYAAITALAKQARRSIADGLAQLKKPSTKRTAKVHDDVVTLGGGSLFGDATAPLVAELATDTTLSAATGDLFDLATANPSNAAIQDGVNKVLRDIHPPGDSRTAPALYGPGTLLASDVQDVRQHLLLIFQQSPTP